jgi:tetratricopeptide (TPR) repeat protein
LEQLAFEAVEHGYRIGALDRKVLVERLPLLANRREFGEAEKLAEQLRTMWGPDPWVSAVLAWLALHHHRDYRRTLQLLRLPLAEGNDPAWYLEMQAQAYLGLARIEDAHQAYRRLLKAPPLDGNTKCRLAFAALATGDSKAAAGWLEIARRDPLTPPPALLVTNALLRLADDDPAGATGLLCDALRTATSAVAVDDILADVRLSVRALGSYAERWAALEEASRRTAEEHKRSLAEDPPTPDAELERALDTPLEIARVALTALAARRDVAAGRGATAARRYERLRGTRFEPETKIAIAQLGAPSGRFRRSTQQERQMRSSRL